VQRDAFWQQVVDKKNTVLWQTVGALKLSGLME
jgi:hypothetical protein